MPDQVRVRRLEQADTPGLRHVLVTKRLMLRPYDPGDAVVYLAMYRENTEHLDDFMPSMLRELSTVAEFERHFEWLAGAWDRRELFVFGVWEQATGEFVGETYLAEPDWDVPSIELGYFTVASHVGRGYATEAARAVVDFALAELGVVRLDLQCAADNVASARVAEQLGFTLEGRQRLRKRIRNGRLVDRLWYGLLRPEAGDTPLHQR